MQACQFFPHKNKTFEPFTRVPQKRTTSYIAATRPCTCGPPSKKATVSAPSNFRVRRRMAHSSKTYHRACRTAAGYPSYMVGRLTWNKRSGSSSSVWVEARQNIRRLGTAIRGDRSNSSWTCQQPAPKREHGPDTTTSPEQRDITQTHTGARERIIRCGGCSITGWRSGKRNTCADTLSLRQSLGTTDCIRVHA